MFTASLGVALIVAQTAVGLHDEIGSKRGKCLDCGINNEAVMNTVVRLQNDPSWRVRERAANALRRVNWRCHPDVPGALCFSLLKDPHEEVREEAAETLAIVAKQGACLPEVHESLALAARTERDLATRLKAKRGLRNLSKHCKGECDICVGTTGGEIVVPGATMIKPALDAPVNSPMSPTEIEPIPPANRDEPALEAPATAPLDSQVAPPSDLGPLPAPAEDLKPSSDGISPLSSRSTIRPAQRQVPRTRVATRSPGIIFPRIAR